MEVGKWEGNYGSINVVVTDNKLSIQGKFRQAG